MNFGFITAWMSLTGSDTISNIPLVVVVMGGCWWSVISFQYFNIFCLHSVLLFQLDDALWFVLQFEHPSPWTKSNGILADTIYACQDIRDDMKVGVCSTAILFGTWIRPLLVGCGLTFLAMLAAAGYLNAQGPAYFFLSVGGTGIHLVWQYRTVDLANPRSCWGVSIIS